MRKKHWYILSLIIFSSMILIACTQIEDEISKEEAEGLVIEKHIGNIGKVEIISTKVKNNKYIIEWENKDNLEKGISKVNKKGRVEIIEAVIE